MELLFDMQQYGQPPAEIIKDLAPGLKFDENGMPIMPNMGSGRFLFFCFYLTLNFRRENRIFLHTLQVLHTLLY